MKNEQTLSDMLMEQAKKEGIPVITIPFIKPEVEDSYGIPTLKEADKNEQTLAQAKEKGIKVVNVHNTMSIEETFGMPKMKGMDEA